MLRAPLLSDAGRISLLAGDIDVASMTGTIPHPYSEQMAAEWIGSALAGEEGVVFAIVRSGALIGCTGYRAFGEDHAELGYWIGKPYWGMGYATEAVRALISACVRDGRLRLSHGRPFQRQSGLGPDHRQVRLRSHRARRCATAPRAGRKAHCVTYRLDRAAALAGFYKT